MLVPCCNSPRRSTWWVRLGLAAQRAKRGLDRISALRCAYFAPAMVGALVWRALVTNPSIGVLALLGLFGLLVLVWWAASWTNTGRKTRRREFPRQSPVRGPPYPAVTFIPLRTNPTSHSLDSISSLILYRALRRLCHHVNLLSGYFVDEGMPP